ncbi:hypothetical protein KC333_g5974 [Hortaea werneckii]|nr:hypothetical protein KC333_g5974 [Hortaea werneckii]KAI7307733.1 hypothetical protein KC326_g7580 [Hortaea werneckii]
MAESDTHNNTSPKGFPAPSNSSDVASQEHRSFLGPQLPDDIELDSIDACSHGSSSSRTSGETPREHHSPLSYAPLEQSAAVSPKVSAQADALVDKAIDDEESERPPSTRLKRSIYTILIAIVYTSLALFAWIILCIQSTRPITTKSYSLNVLKEKVNYDFTSVGGIYPKVSPYVRNEEYFQRARIIQALTSVLTIPLTSALCSKAAVAFFQRKASVGLSMRKLTTMADRGWTDLETILKVFLGGWQKYGSPFLLFAILLNGLGGATFGVLSLLEEPYLAQLPTDYNTGVVRQFIPRFNVSISRENITEQGMPKECMVGQPGAFYVNYANEVKDGNRTEGDWALEACMPATQRRSPWQATRSRQDITETLYLKLRSDPHSIDFPGVPVRSARDCTFKITLNTTAGYFELPNYLNGQTAGPLLTDDPSLHCGTDCPVQRNFAAHEPNVINLNISSRQATHVVSNSTVELENVVNKGPLLTVALALFGKNSFIPSRLHGSVANLSRTDLSYSTYSNCVDQAPMMGLLRDTKGMAWGRNQIDECVTEWYASERPVDYQISQYVGAFLYNSAQADALAGDERITNAFLAAAYLAIDVWMDNPYQVSSSSITFDLGADTDIPVISQTGMVLISILLGLDLTCLLGLAIYSSLTPTWTNQFDAFAMMRLGAAMHEKMPLDVSYSHSQVKVLDTTSGFVGDGPEETTNGSIRQLTLGATTPVERQKEYRCYKALSLEQRLEQGFSCSLPYPRVPMAQPPSASSNSPSRSPSGNALSQSHSKASPVLKPSSLKTDSSVQSTPLHSPNPHHQRKDSNSLQPSPAVSHRSSFAENLRTYPPSPRAQRHQSFSGQALTELLMHPPVKGSGDDARFKGRDWRNIQISEIIEPAETRFVELSSSIEATTKLLIKSGAPNVVLIRESTKTKTAISTFDFSDLNAYLLLVLGLSQPDDLAGKLAERARSGEAIPLSDAMDHLRAREEPTFLPHTATLTRAMEVLGGGAHRVLINKEGSSETIGILTQLRLVRFFWENHKNFAATEALYARSLKDLQLGAKEVVAINGDKPLSDALRLMHDEGITSLPVLDSHSNVVGNISHVDVRLLTDTSSIPLLSSSCIHFISVILSERGLADGKDSFPVFHVAPFSTLAHTVAKLCATRSHRMWIVDAPSPSTTVPPSPAVHSNTQPINIEHGAPHLPAPAAHMASPPKSTAGSDMTPGPPFTSINPGVTISASQLPGAAMSGRLSGVVSLTDILNLFARASGLHPGDPEEMRKLRRRSSSSSSRPNIDSVRASAEYMRSSVELGRSSSTSSRR